MTSCESTGRDLSFKWSHHRISSIDSKGRVSLQNPIKHCGSERVKISIQARRGLLYSGGGGGGGGGVYNVVCVLLVVQGGGGVRVGGGGKLVIGSLRCAIARGEFDRLAPKQNYEDLLFTANFISKISTDRNST